TNKDRSLRVRATAPSDRGVAHAPTHVPTTSAAPATPDDRAASPVRSVGWAHPSPTTAEKSSRVLTRYLGSELSPFGSPTIALAVRALPAPACHNSEACGNSRCGRPQAQTRSQIPRTTALRSEAAKKISANLEARPTCHLSAGLSLPGLGMSRLWQSAEKLRSRPESNSETKSIRSRLGRFRPVLHCALAQAQSVTGRCGLEPPPAMRSSAS